MNFRAMNPPKMKTQLSASVKLVARMWLDEPDAALLATLAKHDIRDHYESLGGVVPDRFTPDTINELACDYCRLLVGPRDHLPPVQSIWQRQQFQSEAATSTQTFFELLPDYRPPSSIPDHLGNQLDFVAELFASESDGEAVGEIIQAFGQKHLTWCIPLLKGVPARAETGFYRGVAAVTSQLVREIC